MNKKKLVVISITVAFIGASGILYSLNPIEKNKTDVTLVTQERNSAEDNKAAGVQTSTQPTALPESQYIYVHICGEVLHPNVYQMEKSDRVIDVILVAGGFTKEAAGDYINQAQALIDGQKIYIPSKKEVKDQEDDWKQKTEGSHSEQDSSNTEGSILVNINQATIEELMTLPGIGQAKAKSIMEYREKAGGFQEIEDIMKIEGIKDGVFNKIREYITIK